MPSDGISGRTIKVGCSFRTQSFPPGFAHRSRENHCRALTPNRKISAILVNFRPRKGPNILRATDGACGWQRPGGCLAQARLRPLEM